jgi:ankyrin repeat protein
MFSCSGSSIDSSSSGLDNPQCARMLIEAGADVTKQNKVGQTCLHLAVERGFIEIVRYICNINFGDDGKTIKNLLKIKDKSTNKTALELAIFEKKRRNRKYY